MTLHYQPQVSADGTRMVAVEALLRTIGDEGGDLGAVLRGFEQPEAAQALDWWVLERAFRDAARWPNLAVSVNLSAARFHDADLVERLAELAARAGVSPSRIELEILENAYINDFEEAAANMAALRKAGFHIVIDDFGTGYSSLSYLLNLPIDKLKIDRSFVRDVRSVRSAAIVQAVTALARTLGIKVAVEGVETEEQYRFVRTTGCHYVQGWYFSKAVDADRLSDLVKHGAPFLRAAH